MSIPISKLKSGNIATIESYLDDKDLITTKLITMGLTIGAKIEILNKFMGTDPILIKVRNGRIALRKKEAAQILVTKE